MRCGASPAMYFAHMHLFRMRFHLERKTGGLTRILERGRNGIETIVRMVMHPAVPDHRRILLLLVGVLLWQFELALCRRDRCDHRRLHGYTTTATNGGSASVAR